MDPESATGHHLWDEGAVALKEIGGEKVPTGLRAASKGGVRLGMKLASQASGRFRDAGAPPTPDQGTAMLSRILMELLTCENEKNKLLAIEGMVLMCREWER